MISSVQHRDMQWIIKWKLISRGLPDCICSATAAKHKVPNQSWSKRDRAVRAPTASPPSVICRLEQWSPVPALPRAGSSSWWRTSWERWCCLTRRPSFTSSLQSAGAGLRSALPPEEQSSRCRWLGDSRYLASTTSPNTLRRKGSWQRSPN